MAGETWPSISSALEETIAQLDRLHGQPSERMRTAKRDLDALVATLGHSSVPWGGDPADDPMGAWRPAMAPRAEPRPYVSLPERTTHGGPFGPAVRAKLIEEALARR
ncbi:MAG: hypothetical protein MUE61_08480 [Vicinamibacterales bacterium]|jgi:hypothetical protein|nr:hypothetical protein [Vicinamibacterales bacterium]